LLEVDLEGIFSVTEPLSLVRFNPCFAGS